jgi:hypothetical protein
MSKIPSIAFGNKIVALASFAALPAHAHFLWFEGTPDGRAHLYFGEYAEGLRERSPGRLDEITVPTITRAGVVLPAKRETTAFNLAVATTPQDCLFAEERGMVVKDWRANGIGIVKPMFYARSVGDCIAAEPGSGLDVRPLRQADQFQVTLSGQPLANIEVIAHTPIGWAKAAKTDARGLVTLKLPWNGLYVLEVIHLQPLSGEFQGVAFEAIRHRATLSVLKISGPALP